jgi:hypothetical protein
VFKRKAANVEREQQLRSVPIVVVPRVRQTHLNRSMSEHSAGLVQSATAKWHARSLRKHNHAQ